jgi:hypothetical protein
MQAGLSNAWDLNYVTLGWGEGWHPDESENPLRDIPDVDKPKWISEGKAMTNLCDRWFGSDTHFSPSSNTGGQNPDRVKSIQYVYFNGLGYETWENVWGTWNGITARAGEVIRRYVLACRNTDDASIGSGS